MSASAKKNSREAIRERMQNAPAYKKEVVHVPEWDADIELRSMPVGVHNGLSVKIADDQLPAEDFGIVVVINSAYDEDGQLLYTEADLPWLRSLPSHVFEPIARAAAVLNGFRKADPTDEESTPVGDEAKK